MRNKIQAPGKQVLHKQVPKAQALQKEKDPRLVAVGGFGQARQLKSQVLRNFATLLKIKQTVKHGALRQVSMVLVQVAVQIFLLSVATLTNICPSPPIT